MVSLEQSLLLKLADDLAGVKDEKPLWLPNPDHPDGTPNPQRLAYQSEADILGYGGAGGGGKTSLLLGLAATNHKRSVIFRRTFPALRGVIEDSRAVFNPEGREHSKDSYNESLHRWSLDSGRRMVEFEACQYEKDKEKQRGRPRDFYGFDEATEFTRTQIEFITAWNRSTDPLQRCRVVLTFNPPGDETGSWVIGYFLPWIAYLFPHKYTHPDPATPGELRWYATVAGEEIECENGEVFEHKGERVRPRSRTFIPAKLADNPFLANTDYWSVLQSLREPLRSQLLYGDFAAEVEIDPWQVIPIEWVRLAQQRWMEREKPRTPLTAVGVDAARGGRDKLAIAKRYDNWFDKVKTHQGVDTDDGPKAAHLVFKEIEIEPIYINLDAIGVGSSVYDSLKPKFDNTNVIPFSGAEGSSYRDRTGKYKMRNKRAEMYWRMYDALNPITGDDIALPPDNEIVADLCAARYKPTTAGIVIEEKEEIKKRIGRSPDVGEALMMAHFPGYADVSAPVEETTMPARWNRSGAAAGRWRRSR